MKEMVHRLRRLPQCHYPSGRRERQKGRKGGRKGRGERGREGGPASLSEHQAKLQNILRNT